MPSLAQLVGNGVIKLGRSGVGGFWRSVFNVPVMVISVFAEVSLRRITILFDSSHHSWTAVTPVIYERDSAIRTTGVWSFRKTGNIIWGNSLVTPTSVLWSVVLNSLWPSDTICRQRSGSTLAQVMACCLTAPSHYLNQCWLIISEVQWRPY